MAHLAHASHRLGPAEGLLDPFANTQADGIAGMARGPAINRRTPPIGILRQIRRHIDLAEFGDEVLRIKAFIAVQRDLLQSVGMRFYQVPRGQTLRMASGACSNSTDDQAIAIVHQRMPHEGQLGFLAASLAVKRRIGVGG